ncbi:MAG: S-methyl-5'-thioinosine phosphorylase [Lautropia sp.]|nr:MAG: S-methyl-5'-thioinosine phosphorylase [Pseudomonadota bacterium]MBC6958455.1 S-methyl-5'-thioinosine phosphorylase [Lautropia sp.]MCL4700405.1 S-methyl-5'-thioinosine phosphorylase [Burkholderiaceae bacterium]MCZ2415696.1 S-methyl-5'-thioinosine phosphorylase [Burkholderiales bacterium]MDL1906949.1 S-methyl-5'-thioinosine phosphorylase [Betaproteobacteria bacterium PRO1]
MLAIIGGSGFAKLAGLGKARREVVRTPYGDPSCALTHGELDGRPIVFLARHGYGHTIAPHEINYRANVWALRRVEVTQVVAVATVGGIRADCVAGSLVVPDQIVDYTWGRKHTYFEGVEQPVTHIDFTWPYDAALRNQLLEAARRCGRPVIDGAVYGCTQGPRLETAAEIARLARDGCDLVGMTGMPEAALAREAGLAYASLCVVANQAAGLGASRAGISMPEIHTVLEATMGHVRTVLAELARA